MRRTAESRVAVVAPDERRVHTAPTAAVGGAAMIVAFLIKQIWSNWSDIPLGNTDVVPPVHD